MERAESDVFTSPFSRRHCASFANERNEISPGANLFFEFAPLIHLHVDNSPQACWHFTDSKLLAIHLFADRSISRDPPAHIGIAFASVLNGAFPSTAIQASPQLFILYAGGTTKGVTSQLYHQCKPRQMKSIESSVNSLCRNPINSRKIRLSCTLPALTARECCRISTCLWK